MYGDTGNFSTAVPVSAKLCAWNIPVLFGIFHDMNAPEGHTLYHRAGAILGSGRNDAEWDVAEDVARRVFALWKGLRQFSGNLPVAQQGAYAGCFLRYGDDLELFASAGIVTMMTRSRSESRVDEDRSVERYLLSTAPAGIRGIPDRI